jgi:tetratricopeptide (TPR) repeat protein
VALVFISYSAKHRDLTATLAAAIEGQYGPGSVWWDQALESRAGFEPQIKIALERARVVVVIWSIGATASDFIYSEASEAARRGKLLNVRPPDVPFSEIPKPFDIYHVDDLGSTERILATIASVMRGIPVPTRVPLAEVYRRHHGKSVLEEKQLPLPTDLNSIGPSDLLLPKYAVVDYDDATGMRERVLAWCLSDTPTGGRLVHGAGGIGKTRLMIEVAARLRQDHGWQAGFLDRPPDDESVARQRWQALEQLITHGTGRGLLIVMDYAEARRKELETLTERLWQRDAEDIRPIRLTLLTRSGRDWWTTLINENEVLRGLFRGRPGESASMPMPDMTSSQQRLDYFAACVRALKPVMRAQGYTARADKPSATRLVRIQNSDRYARPLAIQMEAMLWLASSAPEDQEQSVDKLLARVLGLERVHWTKLLGPLDDDRSRDFRRGVAQVTAVQGVDTASAAEQLVMADRFYNDRAARAKVDPVVRSLAIMYGRPDGGIAPLEPDLIGEHHVAGTADAELIDGCVAWIESEPPNVRAKRYEELLNVLQRATQVEHGETLSARASALLDHIIRHHGDTMGAAVVAVMMNTSGALFSCLAAQVETLPEPALATINFALPIQYVPWMEFSLRVAELYTTVARRWISAAAAAELAPAERHALLNRAAAGIDLLGIRLLNIGRREEGLAASAEAVDIRRALCKARPDAFFADLAQSLTNVSVALSGLNRREEALAASREAVDIHRTLDKARPNTLLAELARSLNNVGVALNDLGRREEALAASMEAVDMYRALAKARPAFLTGLARSLNNVGVALSDLGRRKQALGASKEAVDIFRELAKARPNTFRPDLAKSLINLGRDLSSLGRHNEALAASTEAVGILRALAETRPHAFQPDLARSLTNLGRDLSDVGRREEASTASREAVEIFRPLVKTSPEAFLPDLARSLTNLGRDLSNLGRPEAALVSMEALDIRKRLAKVSPNASLLDDLISPEERFRIAMARQ